MNLEQLLTQWNDLIPTLQALNVAYLGVTTGIFETLHTQGKLSIESLEEKTGIESEYLKRFCMAAYAFDFLDKTETLYSLAPMGQLFVDENTKQKTLPAVFQSVFYPLMTSQILKFAKTGAHLHTFPPFEDPGVFPWMWAMMEHKFSSLFLNEVLPKIPFIEEIDRQRGVVVDIGCGNGWLLRNLAKRFTKLKGIGIDVSREGVEQAQSLSAGQKERLQFIFADFFACSLPPKVSLFIFSRTLHHLWTEKSRLVEKLAAHLESDSKVLVWEPLWPEKLDYLKQEKMKPIAFQNLHENVEGNRLLEANEIEGFLKACGLSVQKFLLENGLDAIFVGTKD